MALGIDLELVLPRDNATVPLVRHLLRHMLTEFGVSAPCVGDIELAVTEAAANVVEHAHGDDEYRVEVAVDEERCRIEVIDAGAGFDGREAPTEFPPGGAEQGRGILLMQALMDEFEFESDPDAKAGTVVRLVKDLVFDTAPLQPAEPVPPHGS